MNRVICSDTRLVLRELHATPTRYAAIVWDPPGALEFMGEAWDALTGPKLRDFVESVMRLSAPITEHDAWSLTWGHPKTSHWTACGVEGAGWIVEGKIIHLNAEAKPRDGEVAPGHEEWILARRPGTPRPLKLDLWKLGTTAGREPRTVLVGSGYGAVIDELVGVRRSGAISSVRAPDKGRHTYGAYAGTDAAKAAAASAGGPTRYFPSWDQLMLLYAPRARHRHRELTPGGRHTEHTTAKSPAAMLPMVDLVSGTGGPVLDPTCGSGATLAAAAALGLQCTGIEWIIDHAVEAAERLGVQVEDWRRR